MSIEIKLEAKNATERQILDFLTENASEALAEKINGGTKTLAGAWKYVEGQARKHLGGKSGGVDDATVFGWAVHFFEEGSVQAATDEADEAQADDEAGDDETPTPFQPKAKKDAAAAPAVTEFERMFGGGK